MLVRLVRYGDGNRIEISNMTKCIPVKVKDQTNSKIKTSSRQNSFILSNFKYYNPIRCLEGLVQFYIRGNTVAVKH